MTRAVRSIIALSALVLASSTSVGTQSPARARQPAGASPFRVTTDEFWLNLHHFLYVLGRAELRMGDAGREAVRDAPKHAEQGLAALSEAERTLWREAVTAHAARWGRKDVVFDSALAVFSGALTGLTETSTLPALRIDTITEGILRRAAPVYAKGWWPAHRAANRAWADSMRTLVGKHGATMLAYVTRAYQLKWPAGGYPIRVTAYSNWAGAYSTRGDLLVMSSLAPSLRGDYGLETMFHESMHQWDDAIIPTIDAQAKSLGVKSPVNLSHMLIFYTAGEATHSVLPAHVPYAESFGVWDRGWRPMQGALDEIWKPYLAGQGTRDAAIGALVKRLGVP